MGGIEGDGDIFNPKNQAEFVKFVKDNTDGKGVYFVMADGVGVQIVFKGICWAEELEDMHASKNIFKCRLHFVLLHVHCTYIVVKVLLTHVHSNVHLTAHLVPHELFFEFKK